MTRVTASKIRGEFSEMLERVTSKRERIAIRRRGKVVAALVPAEDLAVLEAEELQDRRDAKEARRRLANPKEVPIPYERARKAKATREFIATPQQKRALAEARKNRARGNYMTLHELRRSLETGR